MKRFDVELLTNFYGSDYNMKIYYKCYTVEDLKFVKQAINDYFDNQIAFIERNDAKE